MNDNINNEVEKIIDTTSNTNQIFDLIQSIQSKLNTENNTNDENINQDTNDNQVQNINNIINEDVNNNNTVDFSSILKNIDLGNLFNTFNNIKPNETSNNYNNNFNIGGLDPGLIMKFGNMFSSATQSDPKRNLLLSLKPFLRKTRQDKLNEYITILTIVDAIGIFNSKGSDK